MSQNVWRTRYKSWKKSFLNIIIHWFINMKKIIIKYSISKPFLKDVIVSLVFKVLNEGKRDLRLWKWSELKQIIRCQQQSHATTIKKTATLKIAISSSFPLYVSIFQCFSLSLYVSLCLFSKPVSVPLSVIPICLSLPFCIFVLPHK